jgi:alpha-acetolactate decarboxylase
MVKPGAAKLSVLLAAVCLIAALAGCSAHFSTSSLSGEEVAKEAQKQFDKVARERGQGAFPKIVCPDELEEVEEATTHCFAKAEGEKIGIHVEVTSVEDGEVNMHFETEDKPAK